MYEYVKKNLKIAYYSIPAMFEAAIVVPLFISKYLSLDKVDDRDLMNIFKTLGENNKTLVELLRNNGD